MPEQPDPTRDEERETVSFSLPRRLVRFIAMHGAVNNIKTKSGALEDLLATAQVALAAEPEREAVAS